MTVIDTHAHIYPDAIAQRAAESIGDFYHIPMCLDGTLGQLMQRGAAAGISRFLVHSVAVTPSRVHSINDYLMGVCAALGNASIWNMSNNERFLKSPANASMAAAEVCAIPEMKDSLIFTILSMERGQFVGGAVFNSRCTFSERKLYMSADPVVLDFISWECINKYRRSFGFEPISPMPALLNYCKELQIGDWDLRSHERVFVDSRKKRR